MKKIRVSLIVLVLMTWSIASANASSYTIRLQWIPQTQFAGYYMASEKGFYKEAGIDAEIKPANPNISSLRSLIYKDDEFETAWLASGIIMRSNASKKIVLIAQFFQRPALILMAKKSSGINTIRKFSNHTLGVWDGVFSVLPRALIKKYKDQGVYNVKIVSQGFTIDPFLKGEIDIISAMRYNEYNQILKSGINEDDLIIFDFGELGMNVPEDGLYVREKFFNENQEICRKVVTATLRGWQYAFEHKAETVRMITDIANKTEYKTTPDKQRWMLDVLEKLMDTDTAVLKKQDFDNAVIILKSLKMLRDIPVYEDFYRK